MKPILLILFLTISFSLMAQTTVDTKNGEKPRATIEMVNNQKALVLKTGRSTPSNNPDIVIKLDDETRTMLVNLAASQKGARKQITDMYGYKVDIFRAEINNADGLIFSSGTKSVSITKQELEALK